MVIKWSKVVNKAYRLYGIESIEYISLFHGRRFARNEYWIQIFANEDLFCQIKGTFNV
jgi:hypothetical protein